MSNENDDWAADMTAGTALANGGSGFDDGIDLDLDGIDPDAFSGAEFVDKAGKYHLEVESAEYDRELNFFGNVKPGWHCKCRVIHSVQGQSPGGSLLMHDVEIPIASDKDRVAKSGAPMDQVISASMCRFFFALGILAKSPEGKWISPAGKFSVKTDADREALAERMKACQFIGHVVRRPWLVKGTKDPIINDKTGKPGESFEFDQYHPVSPVDDPANYGVPMNQSALAAIGKKQAVAPANGTVTIPASAANGKRSTATANTATQQTADAIVAAKEEELEI